MMVSSSGRDSMRCSMFLCTFLCIFSFAASAQDRAYGRSMVVTDRGIVATSHVLASQAGARILAQGGSAIDAAIAANAVLGVTEPMMNGIGGDLFLLYWDAKTGKLYGLNASGWAPQNLTIDFLKKQGMKSMPEAGIHSATVPGAVDGWAKAHQRFGRLPWKDLFTPAIYYARAWLRGAGNHSGLLGSGTGAAEADARSPASYSCLTENLLHWAKSFAILILERLCGCWRTKAGIRSIGVKLRKRS